MIQLPSFFLWLLSRYQQPVSTLGQRADYVYVPDMPKKKAYLHFITNISTKSMRYEFHFKKRVTYTVQL